MKEDDMASEIVVTNFQDVTIYSISYDVPKTDTGEINGKKMAGKKLTGGKPFEQSGVKGVKFEQKVGKYQICLKTDTRPDLAELVAEYTRLEAEKRAAREARWAAKRAADEAVDQIELDKMSAKVAELVAQIPDTHIRVTVTKTGDLDGDPILEFEAENVKLSWSQVEKVGWAGAIRPGALGAFAEEWICMISRDKLAGIAVEQGVKIAEKEAKKAARRKELEETPVPAGALEDYRRYRGNADKAWEAEDEGAWAVINRWAPYIEAQYNSRLEKIKPAAESYRIGYGTGAGGFNFAGSLNAAKAAAEKGITYTETDVVIYDKYGCKAISVRRWIGAIPESTEGVIRIGDYGYYTDWIDLE